MENAPICLDSDDDSVEDVAVKSSPSSDRVAPPPDESTKCMSGDGGNAKVCLSSIPVSTFNSIPSRATSSIFAPSPSPLSENNGGSKDVHLDSFRSRLDALRKPEGWSLRSASSGSSSSSANRSIAAGGPFKSAPNCSLLSLGTTDPSSAITSSTGSVSAGPSSSSVSTGPSGALSALRRGGGGGAISPPVCELAGTGEGGGGGGGCY